MQIKPLSQKAFEQARHIAHGVAEAYMTEAKDTASLLVKIQEANDMLALWQLFDGRMQKAFMHDLHNLEPVNQEHNRYLNEVARWLRRYGMAIMEFAYPKYPDEDDD